MDVTALYSDQYCLWDDFCLKSIDTWFWHTTKWLDYGVLYGAKNNSTKNMSFYVTDDTGVLAICPLLLEKIQMFDGKTFNEFSNSGSGGDINAPALRKGLSQDRRDKVLKLVFSHIDQLAKINQVSRVKLRMTALADNDINYNWLLKYGFYDTSLNSQIIDLSLQEDKLWGAMSKGHKYDVKNGQKYYEIIFMGRDNANKDLFDQYRFLHHKTSGRVTRPIETFEMMYNWILMGDGLLCGIKNNTRHVGFSYISLYKDSAYYSSASDDPEFVTNVPISHVMQWSIIRWLKEHGYKRYEIGTQIFSPQIYHISTRKDINISLFKRGFGGKTVPFFRGEKYYNKEYMKDVFNERIENLYRNDLA